MIKKTKIGEYVTIMVVKESIIHSIIKDVFSLGFATAMVAFNVIYLSNNWALNWLAFMLFLVFCLNHSSEKITNEEMMEIIEDVE